MSQNILIVGASRGIGLEMARQALARGDRVTGTVRSQSGAAALGGIGARSLMADVTDGAALDTAAAAVKEPIDLLILNAGVYRGRGGIDAPDSDAGAWSDVLMTNVAGPFLAARAFLGRIRRPGGRIAILSSAMGSSERAPGGSYLYRASKAAATNVARNLAAELAPQIAVGAYHPGWVRTDMGSQSADIAVEDSASGLLSRFDALGPETSGVFEDYAGKPIPF